MELFLYLLIYKAEEPYRNRAADSAVLKYSCWRKQIHPIYPAFLVLIAMIKNDV
jgi:hypothetical protein